MNRFVQKKRINIKSVYNFLQANPPLWKKSRIRIAIPFLRIDYPIMPP